MSVQNQPTQPSVQNPLARRRAAAAAAGVPKATTSTPGTTEDPVVVARRVVADADPEGTLPRCGIRAVHIGSLDWSTVPDAVQGLLGDSAAGQDPRTVALLMDGTVIRRRGEAIKPEISRLLAERYSVREVVLDDGHSELHASEPVLEDARTAVAGADAVVSIGGGTITDIGKVASASAGVPLVVVQTAASVDGFTDDVSVLLRNGVKRTTPTRWPDIVLADVDTVHEAPRAMKIAGFGEFTSMFTAPADWLLAALVGTDTSFHRAPVLILDEAARDIDDWSVALDTDPQATGRLARALAVRGIATGVSGGTACLSGVEHLISHMLDLSNGAAHRPIGLHGAQVGAAGVVAAATWQLLFDRLADADLDALTERVRTGPLTASQNTVRDAFSAVDPSGAIGGECWSDYGKKAAALDGLREQLAALLTGWPAAAERLRPLVRTPDRLATALVAAGAPARLTELGSVGDADHGVWAVTNCAYMRNRLTAIDLLIALGWWEDSDIAAVLEAAERAVAGAEADRAAR
ncbi:iron-containing alcohol dehydrogenase [Nakamurella flavida]|uniref:Iron-containing alcohol dehydrogenase n=1 Tax=Nakamurella flavida TaxID=363630 RepID=A0A938YFS5_9ACTN|nr:iron-containing alcohol dehydrogenase [Nakamurella flavida]MBM9475087.1 iron-containing alcohol dehydrogenase [Nakamurella flavida]MDP9776657.1 glycerol-1-phosphate dehydrogenase [NAD(P)+] [Nakamurella flavida]